MNAAELAVRRERVLGVGTEFFCDKPVHLVRDEELQLHDATRKVRPPVVFGRDHADAFLVAFEETVRGLH